MGLDLYQIDALIAGGLTRQQVLGLNLHQTQALQNLQEIGGLTAEHLQGRNWFNASEHFLL